MTGPEHYEVELREVTHENSVTSGLRITGEGWHPVKVFRKDRLPTPLAFKSLNEARGFAERDRPGSVRIVRVTEEGERQVAAPAETKVS